MKQKRLDIELVKAVAAPREWSGYRELQRRYSQVHEDTVKAVLAERVAVDDFCEELMRGWNLPAIFRKGLKVAEKRALRADLVGALNGLGVILRDASARMDMRARNN